MMGNSASGTGGWLTLVPLFDFFFFFLPPMQAASPPPQSASKQQRARMPNKIHSHKRLLEEFSVVVVTAVLCAPWVVGAAVVTGTGVVVFSPIIPAATAKAVAPAITPPPMAFLPGPGPGFGGAGVGAGPGPGAAVVSQGEVDGEGAGEGSGGAVESQGSAAAAHVTSRASARIWNLMVPSSLVADQATSRHSGRHKASRPL